MKIDFKRQIRCLFLKMMVLTIFFVSIFSIGDAAVIRNFTPRYQINVAGDIALIGNTLLTNPAGQTGEGNNNDYVMQRVDIDSISSTFDSSSAQLNLPAGSTVVWAGLYWGADLNAGAGGVDAPNKSLARTVLFRTPANSAYVSLTATQYDSLLNEGDLTYQGFVEVTNLVKNGGNGSYFVANVQAATGENKFAGWSLAVVYQNPVLPNKNLTVFDGYADISTRSGVSPTLNINVAGFQTPSTGAIQTTIGVVAYEGDRSLTGDQFLVNGAAISDATTPSSNFFNSRISAVGTTVTTKSPNYSNQLGFDIKTVNAPGRIGNNATGALLTFTSSGDRYLPGVLTFGTLLYTPNITLSKTSNLSVAYPGDEVTYTISMQNMGAESAINAAISDPLPNGLIYTPGSITLNGVPLTDAIDGDVASYDSATRKIIVNIGTGATSTTGGSLPPNMATPYVITFKAIVDPAITVSQPIENIAELNAYANILGYNIRILSSPVTRVQVNSYTISGYVYDDLDNTSNDVALPGVVVNLTGATIGSVVTDASGFYQFTGLRNGSYTVTPNAPTGMNPTYDPDQPSGADGTSTITLSGNQSNFNFGYRGNSSILGNLFFDMNASGTNDAADFSIQGVRVVLENSSGIIVRTTSTDINGNYSFVNLPAGNFTIRVITSAYSGESPTDHRLPSGLTATVDPDGIGTLHSSSAAITPGTILNNQNFGYRGSGALGDLVWIDYNGNQIQDGAEPPIANATVNLNWTGTSPYSGTYSATATTNSSGIYSFQNLLPGTYVLQVSSGIPSGLNLVGPSSPRSYTLGVNEANLTADFGYQGNYEISGRLHLDWNNNGTYDSGETGLPNVTLTLSDSSNSIIETIITASDGTYRFTNLSDGPYRISVQTGTLPAPDIIATYDPDGVATANTFAVTLSGASLTDRNLGYQGTGRVGDLVWYDQDANGLQNGSEFGATNATIKITWPGWDGILGTGDDYQTQTQSNGIGIYSFAHLPASVYKVEVDISTLLPGVTLVSGTNPITLTLMGGETNNTIDFGFQGQSSISGIVVKDVDKNGSLNSGDTGIANVRVLLLNTSGTILSETDTDNDGNFSFNQIIAGNYIVQVRNLTIPAGLVPSFDTDGISSRNVVATIAPNSNIQFGYRAIGSGEGLVWRDTNGDGMFGNNPSITNLPGEVPYGGVRVELWDNSEITMIGSRITGSNGIYDFSDIASTLTGGGTYVLKVDTSTVPDGAGANPTNSNFGTKIVSADMDGIVKFDFGFRGILSISGSLWNDVNKNNTKNIPPDIALPNIRVTLVRADNSVVAFTTTDADGNYSFIQLFPNTYKVVVQGTDIPSGLTPSYDTDGIGSPNLVELINLSADVANIDFAYQGTGIISGYAWLDSNNNGINDASEAGIGGLFVTATLGTTVFTATTNSSGYYEFENLVDGSWTIQVAGLPADLTQSFDPDLTIDNQTVILLSPNQAINDVNFGYIGQRNLSGTIWVNTNGDGIIDSNETIRLIGVEVQLLQSGLLVATTTTLGDGTYQFTNLRNGNYRVQVLYPGSTNQLLGYQLNFDKDGITTPNQADVVLSSNQNDINFGYIPTNGIRSTVWLDTDGDTFIGSAETGIAGVEVGLFDLLSNQIGISTYTDNNGFYEFSNLPAGSYIVKILSGLPLGVANTYSKDGIGINQATILLLPNTTNTEGRFGYRGTSGVQVLLWNDLDGNGIVNSGETGIPNATVRLFDDNSNQLIGTTQTNSLGFVNFNNLFAGSYRIDVQSNTLPIGLNPTYDPDDTSGIITTAYKALFSLTANQNRPDAYASDGLRFGFRGNLMIYGQVWNDDDGDGVNNNESVLSGATLELRYSGVDGIFGSGDDHVYPITVTDSNGNYAFQNVYDGEYRISVIGGIPSGFQPTYDLDGISTPNTSLLSLARGGNNIINFGYRSYDAIQVKKTTNTKVATIGGLVLYKVEIKNMSSVQISNLTLVDKPPAGFKYVANSGRLDKQNIEPTQLNPMIFENISLAAGETKILHYVLLVGTGVQPGTYKNVAYIENSLQSKISNEASATVEVQKDPIFETTTIIGQVFHDKNENGFPDPGEVGIAGVKVASITGDVVTTDAGGRFHFAGVDPKRWDRGSNYILKVDESSLPLGSKMVTENPKIYRITVGSMAEINFGVQLEEE